VCVAGVFERGVSGWTLPPGGEKEVVSIRCSRCEEGGPNPKSILDTGTAFLLTMTCNNEISLNAIYAYCV
jgi:hypothetical protein